jgi:DNA modification methylase
MVARSINEFGWTNPILVDKECVVIAGHARLEAAKSLGLTEVPTIELGHLTPAQVKAYIIADNRLAELAGWDEALLRAEFLDLQLDGYDLSSTGFDSEEIERIIALDQAETKAGLTAPDEVGEAPEDPVSTTGDLWVLGPHRVLCGDSTKAADVDHLMNGQMADLLFTDPPYGVSYANKNKYLNNTDRGHRIQKQIKNDALTEEDCIKLWVAAFKEAIRVSKEGAPFYACSASGPLQRHMLESLTTAGWRTQMGLVWVKNNHVLGRMDYQAKHEMLFYGWQEGGSHPWYGDRSQMSVLFVDRPMKADMHPTMKPVALVEIAVRNSSKRGDIVLDLFGGSGSTLIAADRLNRSAYLCELEGTYTDVIVQRWQAFTGRDAVLESTGKTFKEMAVNRGKVPKGALSPVRARRGKRR